MLYLILAIASSSLISVFMRLSTDKIQHNVAMLCVNYMMCFLLALGFTGVSHFLPRGEGLMGTVAMGAVHGILYLCSFLLFNISTARNGVVLSSIFMKLGLLVPMVVSIVLFGEMPAALQWVGFVIAVFAIVLINAQPGSGKFAFNTLLLLLLIGNGSGDAMSIIFERLGNTAHAPQFLLYTFLTAMVLCAGLTVHRKQRIGKSELLFGALIGIPNFFSAKFLLASLGSVPAVIVYPTFSVGTMLVVTLTGVAVFHEKLNRRQWFALGIILIALALLNM